MLKKHFIHQKLFLLVCCVSLLMGYVGLRLYWQKQINNFITHQQNLLQHYQVELKFKTIKDNPWSVMPSKTVILPTLQTTAYSQNAQTLWQAPKAVISYHFSHPLSISVVIDGEQFFCFPSSDPACYQIHGTAWQIYTPIRINSEQNQLTLSAATIFYTLPSNIFFNAHRIQLQNINTTIHWNLKANFDNSLFFSDLTIKKLLISFKEMKPQTINNLSLNIALTGAQQTKIKTKTSNNSYKLLIQKLQGYWQGASVNTSGALYIFSPHFAPTGELSIHIEGIKQLFYQGLSQMACCSKLQEDMARLPIPQHLTIALSIREGTPYLGAIPLESSLFQYIQSTLYNEK